MSSYWSAYYGTGLVLSESEFETFLNNYSRIRKPDPAFTHPSDDEILEDCLIQEYDFIRSYVPESPNGISDCFQVTPVLKDDTDGRYFVPFKRPDGSWNVRESIEDAPCIEKTDREQNWYVIFLDTALDGPYRFIENAYPTYESVVEELRGKMERYLPKDFTWDDHIGRFCYAAYA